MKKNIFCLSLIFLGTLFAAEENIEKPNKDYYIEGAKVIDVIKHEDKDNNRIDYSVSLEDTDTYKNQFINCSLNLNTTEIYCCKSYQFNKEIAPIWEDTLDSHVYYEIEAIYDQQNPSK